MNILFCTDGSKSSFTAIENFSYWMKDFNADILCAIDWSFLPDTLSIENSEFAMQCANSADSILDYAEKYLTEKGINIRQKIKMCGSTIDCIMEACEKEKYDFIVLGSHGKKGIQKWLGSVSQEIASISPISSYISKLANNRRKVLFTVDSTELSTSVIEKSLNTLNLEDKEIILCTVYDIPEYLFLEGSINSDWIFEIQKKQETAAMILLNSLEKLFTEKELDIQKKVVLSGSPAIEITKYTSEHNIDLVVCGMRDKKHLSKFLVSSVSKRILENANSDVLIIRQ